MNDPSFATKSQNYRNAVTWRTEEKRIYTFFAEFADYMLNYLLEPTGDPNDIPEKFADAK
jgi:hypothetical protein